MMISIDVSNSIRVSGSLIGFFFWKTDPMVSGILKDEEAFIEVCQRQPDFFEAVRPERRERL
jgi:hypothetical protein